MTISITKEHNRFIPCSLHSDCNNVQKSALKSVNVQRTGKTILQMFAFPFFDGSHMGVNHRADGTVTQKFAVAKQLVKDVVFEETHENSVEAESSAEDPANNG